MLRQLTDQDASFLYAETPETPEHVGGLNLVDVRGDGEAFFARYKALIAERLRHVPLMHAKLAPLPFDLDRPFWVEADVIDLDQHVRHLTAPRPGRMQDLEELVALLHSTPLDRSKPLWELYVIDGLASGEVAIYSKIHHAAMDGASSQALIAAIYDPTPEPRVLPAPPVDPEGGRATFPALVEGVVAHLVRQEIRALQLVPELLAALGRLLLPDLKTLRFRRVPPSPPAPRTILNVGIAAGRTYAARTLPLATARRIAKLTDTKVNDVVLAVCGGALRGWLADKQALPAESLTALVPVSLREAGDVSTANQNGLFACSLASDVADPLERLLAIHRAAADQKLRLETLRTLPVLDVTLPGAGIVWPQLVQAYGRSRLVERLPLLGNLFISNVPGPATPLYVAGAKIVSMYPCSIPFHGAALNITVQSYCDRLDFGLIACRRTVPDLAALADRLGESLAALEAAVAAHRPASIADGGQDHADHRDPPGRDPRQGAEAGSPLAARAAQDPRDRRQDAH